MLMMLSLIIPKTESKIQLPITLCPDAPLSKDLIDEDVDVVSLDSTRSRPCSDRLDGKMEAMQSNASRTQKALDRAFDDVMEDGKFVDRNCVSDVHSKNKDISSWHSVTDVEAEEAKLIALKPSDQKRRRSIELNEQDNLVGGAVGEGLAAQRIDYLNSDESMDVAIEEQDKNSKVDGTFPGMSCLRRDENQEILVGFSTMDNSVPFFGATNEHVNRIEPSLETPLSLEEARLNGVIDAFSGRVRDPRTGETVDFFEAIDRNILDPCRMVLVHAQSDEIINLCDARERGLLLWTDKLVVVDPVTNLQLSLASALRQGILREFTFIEDEEDKIETIETKKVKNPPMELNLKCSHNVCENNETSQNDIGEDLISSKKICHLA